MFLTFFPVAIVSLSFFPVPFTFHTSMVPHITTPPFFFFGFPGGHDIIGDPCRWPTAHDVQPSLTRIRHSTPLYRLVIDMYMTKVFHTCLPLIQTFKHGICTTLQMFRNSTTSSDKKLH